MAEKLPEYKRTESIETTNVPDFGSGYRGLAEVSNSLSVIGAKVAQTAAQAQAQRLGYQAGLDPKGDTLPPITDFDKGFVDAYHQQAQATLGLQAQKLIDDADTQLSGAGTLSPELIRQTHQEVAKGLDGILEQAPTAVKGTLQANFAASLQNQNHQYQNKMVSQQREDQRSLILTTAQQNAKNAHEQAANGNYDQAESLVKQNEKLLSSAVNSRLADRQEQQTSNATVRQSYLNGMFIHKAMQAEKEGKLPQFEKEFANTPPKDLGMTNEEHAAAGQAIMNHMGELQNLRSQDTQIRVAQFNNSVAKDVMGITPEQLQELQRNVTPLQYEQAQLTYIQGIKAFNKAQGDMQQVTAGWSDPGSFARFGEKAINKGFDTLVAKHQKQMQDAGIPTTVDESEVQVAASAGGPIPVFKKSLENKLSSANPGQIESAAQQIHSLIEMGAGHALAGLSENARVMDAKYESLRDSMQPTDAAREATNLVYNQTPEMQKMNAQRWSNYLASQTKDIPVSDFALGVVGHEASDFINTTTANMYASSILEKYSTYYQLSNGDANVAQKVTKRYVEENYGPTGINGAEHMTLHPIEKVLGYKSNDVVPYIQDDMVKFLNERFQPAKEMYAKKQSNEYWETVPPTKKAHGIFSSTYEPVKVKRHTRVGNTDKVDNYEIVLQGNAFDNWDVAVNSSEGMRSLFQIAPYNGVVSYTPNKKAIDAAYMKDHQLK